MTNSMIPYSFIPGTKAKAGEVNANFISLANIIEQNKTLSADNLTDLQTKIENILADKADKSELVVNHTVTEDTDLNDYKTPGTYVFSVAYTPLNIPKGTSGILNVCGTEDSSIKQIWFCDGENEEIFTRNYTNSEWSEWSSHAGIAYSDALGYWKFPNGLIIQWGFESNKIVTYPLAFPTMACPVFQKHGYGLAYKDGDTGYTEQSLTGFSMDTVGRYFSINWIAIGY